MNDVCHNCGKPNPKFLYRAPAFDAGELEEAPQLGLARCQACGIVSTTGANETQVADSYTTDYYGSSTRKFVALIEWVVSLTTHLQARKIYHTWSQQQSGDNPPTVLDIGCGRGNLLRAFQRMGASVLGLEREEFPEQERPRDIVRVGSITDFEYTDQSFDIIILWHVLEHLENPERLLDAVSGHLAKGGLLIIAVPNFSSMQQRLFTAQWFHLDLPRHLVHFESHWLISRLTAKGYSISSTSYMDPMQNIYGFIQSALNTLSPRQPNRFYRMLKYGRPKNLKGIGQILSGGLLSLLILPIAILECLLGTLLRSGATIQIAAKREKSND